MLDQGNSVRKCILKWWVTLNLGATLFNATSLKSVLLDITPTKHSKLYVTLPLSYLPNPSVQNSSTVWPKSASHVLKQYSWSVSLANGTLTDICSHFDFVPIPSCMLLYWYHCFLHPCRSHSPILIFCFLAKTSNSDVSCSEVA